jgi:acyl-coenzyme A thioesterase PaaI-like protein
MLLSDDDDGCFGCGEKNVYGLRMRFDEDAPPGQACARALIEKRFQGWAGIAHGGILATMLDDAMAYVGVTVLDRPGVMARLNLRFLKPAPVGEVAVVRAWATWRRGKVVGVEGEVRSEAGELLTAAEGTFVGKERLALGEAKSEADGE